MSVVLKFFGDEREMVVEGGRVDEILRKAGLSVDAYIVTRDGKPVPEDEVVEDGELVLYPVFSGG